MVSREIGSSLAALLLLSCCLARTAPAQAAKKNQPNTNPTTGEIAARVKRSLVVVTTRDSKGNAVAQGSGFFIMPHIVVTNIHVLKRASEASVKSISDGVSYKVDSVQGFALNHDLCALSVPDAKGVPLPTTSANLSSVGDEILVAGNPEGLEASFSKGIVSAVRKDRGLFQIDAPISPGSSGGPVVNQRGEVIGVAASSMVEGQNLNFAVPIDFLFTDDGTSSGHAQSVWTMGRLSVTNLENDGFHGQVKNVEERHSEYSYNAANNTYIDGPSELSSRIRFSRQGRLEETESYWKGLKTGSSMREYSDDGLIKRLTSVDGNGKSDGGKDYPVDTAIMTYGMNNPLDETREYGDKGSPDYQEQKFDLMGNQVELAFPNKGIRYESRFDAQGRETEQLEYKNGKLFSAERFTYVTNAHGDWVKKHGTFWTADAPNLGYTPAESYYRAITDDSE
jgi:V8-like Glu-specific endopeptidase